MAPKGLLNPKEGIYISSDKGGNLNPKGVKNPVFPPENKPSRIIGKKGNFLSPPQRKG